MNIGFFTKYGKLIGSVLLTAWATLSPLWFGDHHIDRDEVFVAITFLAGVLGTYIVPLKPSYRWGKTAINFILAGAAVAQTLGLDGYQPNDWTIIIGAAVGVLGIAYLPAASPPKDGDPGVVVPAGLTTG